MPVWMHKRNTISAMQPPKKIVSLAYYLPQFHETEENNRWWGKGFSEWTQLNEAKSYFTWQQIRKPQTPFGQYHLLDPKVFEWQQQIAETHAIDGFLVFDYWFGQGKKLLEKPMQLVLEKQLNFKYAFCWANHTWYNKRENITLQTQQYLGEQDYKAYFLHLLPHLQSSNYIKIAGKPIFSIFNPKEVPDLDVFIATFNALALQNGFTGIYWLADHTEPHNEWKHHFDGYAKSGDIFRWRKKDNLWSYLKEKLARKFHFKSLGPFVYSYQGLVIKHQQLSADPKQVPIVFTGWDTTPRHLKRGTVLKGFAPETFDKHLMQLEQQMLTRPQQPMYQVIIIKSWNEWAEGNVIEPDSIWNLGLIKQFSAFIGKIQNHPS